MQLFICQGFELAWQMRAAFHCSERAGRPPSLVREGATEICTTWRHRESCAAIDLFYYERWLASGIVSYTTRGGRQHHPADASRNLCTAGRHPGSCAAFDPLRKRACWRHRFRKGSNVRSTPSPADASHTLSTAGCHSGSCAAFDPLRKRAFARHRFRKGSNMRSSTPPPGRHQAPSLHTTPSVQAGRFLSARGVYTAPRVRSNRSSAHPLHSLPLPDGSHCTRAGTSAITAVHVVDIALCQS